MPRPSLSPERSHQGVPAQQQVDEVEVQSDDNTWSTDSPNKRPRSGYDVQGRHTNNTNFSTDMSASVGPASTFVPTGQPMPQSWTSGLTSPGNSIQNLASSESSLFMEATSLLNPPQDFGVQLQSTTTHSTAFDLSLAKIYSPNISADTPSPNTQRYQGQWFPTASQTAQGLHLYFTHISNFVPFLHGPTFDKNEAPPYLVLSMLCLGYQYGEDPDCCNQDGSGVILSTHCFHRARVLLAMTEESDDDVSHNVAMVQGYLLLQICAIMYLCGKDSAYGLRMHSRMVSLARSGGLMQSTSIEPGVTGDLDSLWREYVKAESRKRTLYAVHHLDALYYQFLSIPRSLSHLEIKHDLPSAADLWTATSATEWAHRQLVTRRSTASIPYAEAVRLFLSSEPRFDSFPSFDPYGAINIVQFLISSAREMSGWSTMTGRLSMERFGPLKSSLEALEPFIRTQAQATNAISAAPFEATWEIAMIELQMWSPSHTGGLVEGSIDAVLRQSSFLTPNCEFLFECDAADAIQPHVDWFLYYLDTTLVVDYEPPWIALYAFKAFLIAWQLVRGGLAYAMQVVGVQDGDLEEAMAWARMVFQRRQKWQFGKLILASLDILFDSDVGGKHHT